jgi:hypothetical protein
MNALEIGGKTKDMIRSDFIRAYPQSAGTSTFAVFFTDVIRPFGSASVSRSVRIETDSNGYVRLDHHRATIVKEAIAKGLLKELSRIEKNIYPKKDRDAIDRLLRKFGVPPK